MMKRALRSLRAPSRLAFGSLSWTLLSTLLVVGAVPAYPQAEHLRQLGDKLQRRLEEVATATPGVLGVAVVDLSTGQRFGVNAELEFPQGSAIKIPVLIELYRQAAAGRFALGERVPVQARDQVGGSGVLRAFGDGTSHLALRDLAVLMVVLSDNTATNLLIDRVGMESVNTMLRSLGTGRTRLQRRMIRPEDSMAGRENLSTPAEAVAIMERLHRCDLPLSPAACAEVRAILEHPKEGAFARPIPAGVRVAWKPGSITGVATAWALVELPGRPYAVAVMTNYSQERDAEEAVRLVSESAYRHFSRLAGATPYGTRIAPQPR